MKRITLLFLCFLVILVSNAQDASYTGPAKMHVKTFWENAAKLKEGKGGSAANLERQLNFIKEKDPAYNTSAMEAELKTWNEKAQQAVADKKEAQQKQQDKHQAQQDGAWKKINDEKLLQTVLDGTVMQVGHNNLEYVQKAMDEYKTKADAVLAMDRTKYTEKLADIKRYADKSQVAMLNDFLVKTKSLIKEVKKSEEFEPAYQELRFRQMHWDVLRKVYSSDASYEKYYQDITTLINQTGNMDAVKKSAAQNNASAIKDKKMPAGTGKDAALEKALIDGFNSKYKETFKGTAIKAVILQTEWHTERNDITGIVTGRNKPGALVYKGTDGKCYLLDGSVYVYQEYIGGAFKATQVIYRGYGSGEMLCENVK